MRELAAKKQEGERSQICIARQSDDDDEVDVEDIQVVFVVLSLLSCLLCIV